MEITRRTLLGAGTVAGAGLLLPLRLTTTANAVVPATVTPFTEQLPTLAQLGVIDARKGGSATLRMVNATHSFHSGLPSTPTFAYRASGGAQDYLGPVIVARQGKPFNLTLVNKLGGHPLARAIDPALVPPGTDDAATPRTSTHLHGGNTAPGFDGDPTDTFLPGTSKTYKYGNTQEAAGLWYHDHALGITRLNVFAGLAGGYLIRSSNGDDLGDGNVLPPPPFEVPLILQDRMFNADGTFDYPANEFNGRPWAPEFFGDVATVNGKAWPNLNVARGKYRFRVYNGSNARFYNLRLVSGLAVPRQITFVQIGTDGGLLNAPVPLNSLLLGPGERADLVVDFAALPPGTKVVLTNDAVAPFPNGGPGGLPQIMQFTVTSAKGWTQPLKRRLRERAITRLAGRPVAATRSMTLVEIVDPVNGPLMALLNNRNFDPGDASTTVRRDTLEQWDLINTTGDAHPIHLHFTQFQVLNRQMFDVDSYLTATYGDPPLTPNNGASPLSVTPFLVPGTTPVPPAPNEQGWKDTVVAMPGEVTRILVPFGARAVRGAPMAFQSSFTGPYVWHCHILEHEDNDMMQRYVIA